VVADAPGVVMPSTTRELLAASWLAELQRFYCGGLVPLTTAAAMSSSPFPLPLPNVLLSLHGQHQQLQLLHPFHAAVAPHDADRRSGEKLRGCATVRPKDQSERSPVAGASITGVIADDCRKTALTNLSDKARQPISVATSAVTSVHRNRTGLNDFSIPSILARNDRFEGRRRDDDSGSTGSFNGATSGVDSEDAWSACTPSPSAEAETQSKLSNSSSDNEAAFDDDEDLSCPSTDRSIAPVATFGGLSDRPSMLLPSLFCFRQQQHDALAASMTMRPLPSTCPISSSYLSVSPPVGVRRPLQSESHAATGRPVKRRKHNQSTDLTASAPIDNTDGPAELVTRRQMMAPDSSSRQYECPQCDKVCNL
jgi:hypothetical protein